MSIKIKIKQKNNEVNILCKKNAKINSRELEDLNRRTVEQLIIPVVVDTGKKLKLCYDTTGYISLREYLSKGIKKKTFLETVASLPLLIEMINGKYMHIQNLIIDIDLIFVNEKRETIKFIYLPLIETGRADDSLLFLKNLPYYCVFAKCENHEFVKQYIQYFKNMVNFSMYEFMLFIDKLTNMKSVVLSREEDGSIKSESVVTPVNRDAVYGVLINSETLERTKIRKNRFTIGKLPESDLCINEQHVSKTHAEIIYAGEVFMIKDCGSVNHTYINGKMLTGDTLYELNSGDSVRFAGLKYKFVDESKGN